MSRLRFTTAREVFDAFPTAADDIKGSPTAESPPAFVRSLAASGTPEDAVTFCAYTLGRREAVWWACQCVRAIAQIASGTGDATLKAAEDWVRDPDEGRRVAALQLGMAADRRAPFPWLALAAAWSGGNISPLEGNSLPAGPHMTARATRIAILLALANVGARDRGPRLQVCVEGGLRLMQEEPG